MPMSAEDYHDVASHFLGLVRKRDRVTFDRLIEHIRFDPQNPKRSLLRFMAAYAEMGTVRTIGAHSAILQRLNKYVHTEQQEPVRGIRVSLTPAEQHLYRTEYVDLVPVLDFGEFVSALRDLYHEIEMEGRKGLAEE